MRYSIVLGSEQTPMSKEDPRPEDAAALKRRIGELRKELSRLGPLMRGSLVVIGTRNKQPYFSVNIKGKTHLLYLGRRREKKARQYSENYHRLQEIVEEMTLLNMRLLKLEGGH
jgi:hypothetical protein